MASMRSIGNGMLKDDPHHNCVVTTAEGKTYHIHANQMHNLGIDLFQGWECAAGLDRIHIDEAGNIWSGECQDSLLGTWTDWDLKTSPSRCSRERCTGCTDDLMITKNLTR